MEDKGRSWLREGGDQKSRLECMKFEGIPGEIRNRQLDIPVWSSGKRSEVQIYI